MTSVEMSDEDLREAIAQMEALVEQGGPAQAFLRQNLDVMRQRLVSCPRALVEFSPSSPDGSNAAVAAAEAAKAEAEAEASLLRQQLREERERYELLEAGELHTLHISQPSEGTPLSFELFNVGDQITTYTGEVITVTASMRGLLCTADNRLAKLPRALIKFARDFIAMLVTMNNTVMDHEMRDSTQMYSSADDALPGQYTDEFSPSVLMQFMAGRHDSCRIMPEQCVKSYETAQMCCYSRLVLGCVPIVSVRNSGGRLVAAGSMTDSLNAVLSLKASENGLLPTNNDIARRLLDMPKHRHHRRHELDRFFFIEAEEVLAGKCKLKEDVVSVMLQNEAAGKKMPRLQQVLDNGVGLIQTGEEGEAAQRSRIFVLHDEGDLLVSANGTPHAFVKKVQGDGGMAPMYSMFITATAAEVMVAQRSVTPYLYVKLPYNYHGFHNNRIEFRVIERGMEPNEEFENDIRFPKLGLALQKELKGERAVTNGQFMRLRHTLRHMVNHPDHVLPGWRHASAFIRVGKLQHMLAQYVASLVHHGDNEPLNFITMEWHSPHVKNIELRDPLHPERKAQPPVRIFMSRTLFDDVVQPIWQTDFGGGHFVPAIWERSTEQQARDYSLQYITINDLHQHGVIQRDQMARHCEIACISLGSDATMRKAVTMCEKVWRCCGGMSPTYDESHPYERPVRVLCFSGEINGRQQPNKSERHTTVLTDFVHDSQAAQHAQAQEFEAFTKAMSVPTFSQVSSRICGVTLHSLANPPILWADRNAEPCLEQYRGQMRELADMRCDDAGEQLRNLFRGGVIDRRRHPHLAELKDALDAIVEKTSHRRKPQSGQCTAMNTPAARKSAGETIVRDTDMVEGAAGVEAASDARTPPSMLRLQFTEEQKTLAPPRDPNAAARMREADAMDREGQVLSNLKTTARLALFNKGNNHPDFAAFLELMMWYKTHADLEHGLPDWAMPISQSEVDSMPDSVRRAELFGEKNRWSTHMQVCHQRFFDHDAEQDHFVMAEFLQAAMNSLRDTVRGTQGDSYNVYDLWLGTRPGKYRQCLRDVLRLLLERAPGGALPSDDSYLGVFSAIEQLLSVEELQQIATDREYPRILRNDVDTRGVWKYPCLVSPELSDGARYVYVSETLVQAINEHNRTAPASRQLSLANLYRDPKAGDESSGAAVMQAKERSFRNGTVVKLRNDDVADATTEAVVNAANCESFLETDTGISGALRDACGGLSACEQPKRLLVERGAWSDEVTTVPEGRTGVQPATGKLREQGVTYVLHTVGPKWPGSPTEEESRGKVKAIREAVSHSLCVAEALKCHSVTLPPISGGVFAQNNERSEQAARSAVVSEVNLWASRAAPSSLKEVHIVDKSISGYQQLLSAWGRMVVCDREGPSAAGRAQAANGAWAPSASTRSGKAPANNGKAPARGKRPREPQHEAVDLTDSDWEDAESDSIEMQQAIYQSSQPAGPRNRAVRESTAAHSINYNELSE